ncbi:hypothetical protein Pcinc_011800 [Petrolisthes cinctipes]|uniref:Transposase Tc1-like domain-containing protein n=1 Tax=Petrolisthes cinctipes TaxID=88211 RepID=A0AAE1KU38_PETCI|nr:hypothetical protein Pcinc_011800 [Petrolisthes cinctipes]
MVWKLFSTSASMNHHDQHISERSRIVALHDEGLSNRAIAGRLRVSLPTVRKWIRRWQETGNLNDLGKRFNQDVTAQTRKDAWDNITQKINAAFPESVRGKVDIEKKWWSTPKDLRVLLSYDKYRPRPRSRVTSREEDERIIQAAVTQPFINAAAITTDLGLEVSNTTVRRRLHAAGVHHRVPAMKEHITDVHRNTRVILMQQWTGFGGRLLARLFNAGVC